MVVSRLLRRPQARRAPFCSLGVDFHLQLDQGHPKLGADCVESIVIPLDRLSLNGDFRTTRCNMRRNSISILAALTAMCLRDVSSAVAQSAPEVVWEAATPSGLANSIQGVGWSPGTSGRVAGGATGRRGGTAPAGNGGPPF